LTNEHALIREEEVYTLPLEEIISRLKTDPENGLNNEEAIRRQKEYGPNKLPKVKGSIFKVYIAPLLNWLINIYLIVCAILIILAMWQPSVWGQVTQWLAVIAVNAFIAIFQQVRAQSKLEALESLSAPKSRVIRNGQLQEIDTTALVPGDIVELSEGDKVSADARIIKSANLSVNEASLTGESETVKKDEIGEAKPPDTPISQRTNMVFYGTYVATGSARVVVVHTGANTEMGKISGKLQELNTGEIPLRQKVNKLAKYLGIGVVIYLVASILYRTYYLWRIGQLFIGGVLNVDVFIAELVGSLVTGMSIMPINIPLLTTIVLLTGVLAMAKHKVIVRNLNAVESLGRISIIASDKTGTITKNQMTVKWICTPAAGGEQLYAVTGTGFEPKGDIYLPNQNSITDTIIKEGPDNKIQGSILKPPEKDSTLTGLLICGLLNNDSEIVEDPSGPRGQTLYKAIGDATDASILTLFRKSGLDELEIKREYELVREFPFDSNIKRMSKIYKKGDIYYVFTKGATEVMVPLCSYVSVDKMENAVPINQEYRDRILKKAAEFSSMGYRVISLAYRKMRDLPPRDDNERKFIEQNLVYLGMVAIMDPPREGVRDSVREAKNAGITPVMITGDSPETALSIARQVDIADENSIAVEGRQIPYLDDENFEKVRVFARVSPDHKSVIVDRYQKKERVVAMTGDGVNDALALSMADVGIAMGITGTDVAKQASDIVIADDSFNSIVVGVREGRGLFQKIRVMIFFYIAVNLAEALVYFGSSFIPGFYLLDTWQQIYIFMTAHSLPPLGIVFDRIDKGVMKEKPRDTEAIFNKYLWKALGLFAVSFALVLYFVYFGSYYGIIPLNSENFQGFIPLEWYSDTNRFKPMNWEQAKARTMLHTVIFLVEITLVLSIRRINKPLTKSLKEDNFWFVWLMVLLIPFAHFLLMFNPEYQYLLIQYTGINLEVIRLSFTDLLICFAAAAVPIGLLEAYKIRLLKKGEFF